MVASRKGAHTDATLERLLSRMNANVPGELIAAGESAIATIHRTGVWPFVHRRFARSIRILSRFYGNQLKW